jgi:hypothetical protein
MLELSWCFGLPAAFKTGCLLHLSLVVSASCQFLELDSFGGPLSFGVFWVFFRFLGPWAQKSLPPWLPAEAANHQQQIENRVDFRFKFQFGVVVFSFFKLEFLLGVLIISWWRFSVFGFGFLFWIYFGIHFWSLNSLNAGLFEWLWTTIKSLTVLVIVWLTPSNFWSWVCKVIFLNEKLMVGPCLNIKTFWSFRSSSLAWTFCFKSPQHSELEFSLAQMLRWNFNLDCFQLF